MEPEAEPEPGLEPEPEAGVTAPVDGPEVLCPGLGLEFGTPPALPPSLLPEPELVVTTVAEVGTRSRGKDEFIYYFQNI